MTPIVVILVVATLVLAFRFYARRRRMGLLAHRLGLDFAPRGGECANGRFGGRTLSDGLLLVSAINLIHGTLKGIRVAVMDYLYQMRTEVEFDDYDHSHTVVAFPMDGPPLPEFRLGPRTWEIKLFGGPLLALLRCFVKSAPPPEFRLPEYPGFDLQYYVSARYHDPVRACFTLEVVAEIRRYRRMALRSREGWLLIHLDRRRLPVWRLRRFLECALRLRKALTDANKPDDPWQFSGHHAHAPQAVWAEMSWRG